MEPFSQVTFKLDYAFFKNGALFLYPKFRHLPLQSIEALYLTPQPPYLK